MWEDPNFEITFAKAFRKDSDHFARLQRRIDATQRNYRNALHELERLQAEETAANSDREPESGSGPALVSPQNQTTKPENGFVPQTPPADPPIAPAESNSEPSERPPAR
jgi:hypothetical protein